MDIQKIRQKDGVIRAVVQGPREGRLVEAPKDRLAVEFFRNGQVVVVFATASADGNLQVHVARTNKSPLGFKSREVFRLVAEEEVV